MKFTIILTCISLVLGLFSASMPVNGEVEIYDSVVRLHVIANSDSDVDQTLKLSVRDAILECMSEEISTLSTVQDAKQYVCDNTDIIIECAEKCISDNGYSYKVAVETGIEKYPARNYNNVRLPEGEYYSVKIKIGQAEGQNWWCVLFPPLCVGASTVTEQEDELAAVGLTPNEVNILTNSGEPEYELKFKLLEFFKSTFA